jgi:protein SCO1
MSGTIADQSAEKTRDERGHPMTRIYAIAAAAGIAALLGGTAGYVWLAGQSDDPLDKCRGGRAAGGAIGGPFTLIDETGATVTDKDVLKEPSLVYFGYSFCPDVCPLDNQRNAEAVDILEEKGLSVTPIFITIDPARDTPAVMADYTDAIHPKMIGLTGSADQVKAASVAYKTYFKQQPADDEYYLMDHSTFTYLMLPGTGFAEFFDRDTTADKMADTVACFLTER